MIQEINELLWHDAEINRVEIDRSNPGNIDSISLRICWPDGSENELVFNDCYMANLQLNMGVAAPESIREATQIPDSNLLRKVRDTWGSLGVPLNDLKHVQIKTNSTNSIIDICYRSFEVKQID